MQSDQQTSETDPLGQRYRAYRPPIAFIVGGFLFGAVAFVAGLAIAAFSWYSAWSEGFDLPLHTKTGWSWLAVGGLTVLGVVFVYCGWRPLGFAEELTSYSVELRKKGFRIRSRGRCEDILWADVELIKHISRFYWLLMPGGPGGLTAARVQNKQYIVILNSGEEYDLARRPLKGMSEFAKILYEVAFQNSIRWEKDSNV
jgi:hypothetical protein